MHAQTHWSLVNSDKWRLFKYWIIRTLRGTCYRINSLLMTFCLNTFTPAALLLRNNWLWPQTTLSPFRHSFFRCALCSKLLHWAQINLRNGYVWCNKQKSIQVLYLLRLRCLTQFRKATVEIFISPIFYQCIISPAPSRCRNCVFYVVTTCVTTSDSLRLTTTTTCALWQVRVTQRNSVASVVARKSRRTRRSVLAFAHPQRSRNPLRSTRTLLATLQNPPHIHATNLFMVVTCVGVGFELHTHLHVYFPTHFSLVFRTCSSQVFAIFSHWINDLFNC